MSLKTGATLGSYTIVGPIGAGGMGEVYKARDSKLDRDVAIKVLPESFALDADRLARFTREAKTLASLNHPNIAQIFGLEGTALVMEFIDGDDLTLRIGRGPMALDEALPIAKQIAEALEVAHDQGIVHRDLKPANIKVRADGVVKVLDFGLAKAFDPASSSNSEVMNSPTLTAHATQMGMIIGTAAYMAPEQAKGRAVDKRADIWAFGVVLFEMLSGTRGYEAEDISDTLAAVLTREVDWTKLPSTTPAPLVALLRDCLVRDPKQRLRDMGEARRVLDRLITGHSGSTIMAAATSGITVVAPPAPLWRRALPWAIAGAAIVVAAVATWRAMSVKPVVNSVTRSAQSLKDLALFANVSRDGTRLAYTAYTTTANGGTGIVLRMLDQFDGKMIPGTENGLFPVFSPDGQWIAYQEGNAGSKIKKILITGGSAITICEGSLGAGGAWGDDNTIVFASGKGLLRVSADGGTPEALTTIDKARGETGHTQPQFLPGGRQVLFTVTSNAGAQFAVRDLDKSGYRTITKGGVHGQYAASGHLTYMRGSTVLAVPFDVKTLAVTGSEVPVVESVSTIGPTDTGDYSFSNGGLLAYFSDAQGAGTTLAWADRAGVTKILPGESRRMWSTGRLSPDGRRVANGLTASNGQDIWSYDVERGTPTRLTFGGQNDFPVWTPDSGRVYYSGAVDGKLGLYVVPVNASAKPAVALTTDSGATPSSISSDGKTLAYFQNDADKRPRIFLLPIGADGKGGPPRPFHEASGAERDGMISPDGRWLAYTSSESGKSEIYVQALSGSGAKTLVSSNGGTSARWSKDGRELFYWSGVPSSALNAVDVAVGAELRVGQPHEVFKFLPGTTWDVTPDRNRFLVELTTNANGATLAIVTNWFDELRRRAPVKK